MLIALLAVLGVDLVVIVVITGVVVARRRWINRQPGVFKGAVRVVQGDAEGLPEKWRRGYGRWVQGVLAWTRGPFMFRNDLLPIAGPGGEVRAAAAGEVKRLGDDVVVLPMLVEGGARVEIAVGRKGQHLGLGPWNVPATEHPGANRSL